jgi:hypothetical protein
VPTFTRREGERERRHFENRRLVYSMGLLLARALDS